ncbi:MAG: ATP-binding protein involved in chromosome partitioning [Bacteroidia bacterium]|jgi:ATP-binding protein involved in chromosome partitioning
MSITKEAILSALSHVDDPDLNKDLVTLNMIQKIEIDENQIRFDVVLTTPACPMKDMIQNACVNAVQHFVSKDLEVIPNMTSNVTSSREEKEVLPGVKNIIAVASGKGGVGKSTVAINLARSLSDSGASVGVLDADIYGPSMPTLFGLQGGNPKQVDGKMEPLMKDGIKVMSIGFLVDENQAIVWRGPMASSAIKQFTTDVNWGELDYLILDLPPGTGDIHLTISKQVPVSGSIIVTTPQTVALADCKKAVNMFINPNINVPVFGIVENMSYFSPKDQPDKKYYLFGKGGGTLLAEQFDLPLLGEIPFVESIRESGDKGEALGKSDVVREAYNKLAGEVARHIAIKNGIGSLSN